MTGGAGHGERNGVVRGPGGRAQPRPLPGARALRTTLRTAHILAFSTLFGGHVYGVAAPRLAPALLATVATGGALLALDAWRAPVWFVQIRGLATLLKLALVAGVTVFWDARLLLLALALVIGAVASHMPGRWRYYSWLHGAVVGPREKG